MTNAFEIGVERHERELKKPDMVEKIADHLLADHMELMADNKRLRDAITQCADMVAAMSPDYVLAQKGRHNTEVERNVMHNA